MILLAGDTMEVLKVIFSWLIAIMINLELLNMLYLRVFVQSISNVSNYITLVFYKASV